MANIMQQVKLKNNTSRNGFDLSYRNAFTAKVGELLPVACYEVLPGDKFKLETQHFTRTMPVNTAAYTRIREYYDWFFVPTNLLWNKFNSFVTQMVDNNQHATGINNRVVLSDTHPYFTTSQINQYLTIMTSGSAGPIRQNMFGFRRSELSAKLLGYLDYGDFTPSIRTGSTPNENAQAYRENVAYNPFPLLAYQKIYQDYFRHSQWEKAYAPSFNVDYINGSSSSSLMIPIEDISMSNGSENMFDLRYANWHKDLFMGLLPNAQYGGFASVVLSDFSGSIKIKSLSNASTSSVGTDSEGFLFVNNNLSWTMSYGDGTPLKNELTILQLRQAEAYQKWKEITQSQQQDYRSQVEAHFGVSPDRGLSEMCRWIDGSVSTLDINEVTNTNITSDNAADIAGKGVGAGQSKTSFSSEVHGYLMCIYHAVPLLDYSFSGAERVNLKTKVTDYAIPEFDRTGMVSVPLIELTNSKLNTNIILTQLGYAPRYYDYKQKVDKVHGAFKKSLNSWVAPFNEQYLINYFDNRSTAALDYQFFKINPATMNPIFAQDVDSSIDSDQLLVNAAFDVKSVRNLDRNGLPY